MSRAVTGDCPYTGSSRTNGNFLALNHLTSILSYPSILQARILNMRYTSASAFSHGQAALTGVLLLNLGTPDAPTPSALRRYLGQFLWDPRVIELPRPLWWLVLHGIILRTRPAKSAAKYASIWTSEGSPLLAISQRQAAAVSAELERVCPGPVKVALAMRYGQPSVAQALQELRAAGVRRLLVLPLYPQYCSASTGSSFDALADELKRWRWLPELRFITGYHLDSAYLAALETSVRQHWQQHGRTERLLLSFHGMPEKTLLQGDPYYCYCQATGRALAERLGLADSEWQLSFQSRFGRAQWLQPYTSATLQSWAQAGVKQVSILCPGFAADCLETLEEIAVENRELFLEHGGEVCQYIPALNEQPEHIQALVKLIRQHGSGWPELDAFASAESAEQRAASRARALALGASD